jgi:hypothetical protein
MTDDLVLAPCPFCGYKAEVMSPKNQLLRSAKRDMAGTNLESNVRLILNAPLFYMAFQLRRLLIELGTREPRKTFIGRVIGYFANIASPIYASMRLGETRSDAPWLTAGIKYEQR